MRAAMRGARPRAAWLAAAIASLALAVPATSRRPALAEEPSSITEEDLPPPSAPGAEDPGWERHETQGTSTTTTTTKESGGAAGAVEGSLDKAGTATRGGLEKAGEATGKALDKAITKTGEGVGYVIDKTGEGLKSASEALSGEKR